jgi:hypothetical protein
MRKLQTNATFLRQKSLQVRFLTQFENFLLFAEIAISKAWKEEANVEFARRKEI